MAGGSELGVTIARPEPERGAVVNVQEADDAEEPLGPTAITDHEY